MHLNNFNVITTSNNAVLPKQRRFLVATSTKEPSQCVICGAISKCRHFGAICCNACATFFRRTISNKKYYFCAFNNNCVIDFRLTRRICPACRLRKCISAGMNKFRPIAPKSKIQNQLQTCNSLLLAASNDSLLLPRIQKFDHSAQFYNYGNNKWLQQLLISTKAIEHQRMTHLPPSPYPFRDISYFPNVSTQFYNEIPFCQMFLNTTDIMSCASDIANEKLIDIVFNWNYLHCVMNTLKYNTLQEQKLTAIDHSKLKVSESSIKAWYATLPLFCKHLDSMVKVVSPIYFKITDLMTKIHNLYMTNEEQAFFLFLGMIEGITRLTSEPRVTRLQFQPLLDTVFRSMHIYYKENFPSDCTATRMGNLIMALSIMNELNKLFSEIRMILTLCLSDSQIDDFLQNKWRF